MNQNYAFGELAQALSMSRKADDIVLALAKLEHNRDLTEVDRDALRYARKFLKEVDSGSRWLSQPKPMINQESARTMSSFVRAAESLSSAESLDKILIDIKELLRAATAVEAGKAAIGDLGLLRRFFGNILNNTLDQVDRSLVPDNELIASV